MSEQIGVERCLSFIQTQLRNGRPYNAGDASSEVKRYRAVTISRQAGCGALEVAKRLAAHLQEQEQEQEESPKDCISWTIFDRNLVEKVLADHHLPNRLARFMPEDWISEVENTLDELFGLHPPSWLLVRQTAETILGLAKLGNVILIGRGANIITSRLDCVFHVRLVAPLETRVQRVQESEHLDRKAALAFIHRADRGRRRYLRKYYHKEINDPLLYHLTINTDLAGYDGAARIIRDCVLESSVKNRNPTDGR